MHVINSQQAVTMNFFLLNILIPAWGLAHALAVDINHWQATEGVGFSDEKKSKGWGPTPATEHVTQYPAEATCRQSGQTYNYKFADIVSWNWGAEYDPEGADECFPCWKRK